MTAHDAPVVGIDLGGTNMQFGVLGPGGEIIGRHRARTRAELGPEGVVDRIIEGVGVACSAAGIDAQRDLAAIGIAVAGAVDIPSGVVLEAVNLRWTNFPLRDVLDERLGCPVTVDNDVNGAVWAEYRAGAGRGARDLIGVWVGTGIGGGIVLDGRLHHGALHTAGEIGHMIVTPDGTPGLRSVEDHCSRTGMRRILSRLLPEHPESVLHAIGAEDPDRIGTEELDAAFEQRDALACHVIGRAADLLGVAMANVVTLLSVDTIVIGGGITEALGDPFIRMIRQSFDREVFPDRCRACRIVMTELAADSGLLGAALLAAERL